MLNPWSAYNGFVDHWPQYPWCSLHLQCTCRRWCYSCSSQRLGWARMLSVPGFLSERLSEIVQVSKTKISLPHGSEERQHAVFLFWLVSRHLFGLQRPLNQVLVLCQSVKKMVQLTSCCSWVKRSLPILCSRAEWCLWGQGTAAPLCLRCFVSRGTWASIKTWSAFHIRLCLVKSRAFCTSSFLVCHFFGYAEKSIWICYWLLRLGRWYM